MKRLLFMFIIITGAATLNSCKTCDCPAYSYYNTNNSDKNELNSVYLIPAKDKSLVVPNS